ncbi:MAG: tRNA-dihydrouridine synthase [Rickettsiales bacterium]|jgi:tRNA-dihydrouridine synthase B|nr:tRNA-dihydrouridine synthase [Rickettsiales bacterium]
MIFGLQFQQFPVLAAPMAGITDQPMRRILRKCNPAMPLMTEMISCHSITSRRSPDGRNKDAYFGENIGAQIFGAEPDLMAEAAKILESRGAAWIDINMGCPVPKVATRAGAGAFLMRDHALAGRIVESVAGAVKIPVSIKTRLGWDEQRLDSAGLVRIAAESGASFAAIHARTRAQGYSGNARHGEAAAIKKSAKIPIIFNGDIKSAADIDAAKGLGADGVMIGRAFLGRPWLFNEPNPGSKAQLIGEHFELMLSYYGKAATAMFRKHAAWYAAGIPGAAALRQKVNQIEDPAEMAKIIDRLA